MRVRKTVFRVRVASGSTEARPGIVLFVGNNEPADEDEENPEDAMGKNQSNDAAVQRHHSGAEVALGLLARRHHVAGRAEADDDRRRRGGSPGRDRTRAAVVTARAEYKATLAKRDAAEVRRRVVSAALRQWVLNRFGATSAEVHDFGYAPRKPSEPTAETKARAVRLNEATRRARGTIGRKKKLAIKGTLDPETPSMPASPTEPETRS